jgi:hypothetical protein
MLIELPNDASTFTQANLDSIRRTKAARYARAGLIAIITTTTGNKYARGRDAAAFRLFLDDADDRPFFYLHLTHAQQFCQTNYAQLALWIHPEVEWEDDPVLVALIDRLTALNIPVQSRTLAAAE